MIWRKEPERKMKAMDDKMCYTNGVISTKTHQHHTKALRARGKPPSKWDDAQKWLVGLSSEKAKPRNSNADDRRLLHSQSQRGRDSCSSAEGVMEEEFVLSMIMSNDKEDTKKIDCNELVWRASKPPESSPISVKSICLRDMGTEMTPIVSNEPSRTGTPLRATTPVLRSPVSSRTSTPGRRRAGTQNCDSGARNLERAGEADVCENGSSKVLESNDELECEKKSDPLESRAMAWDEAERAKYMARYKREEVKIQAWENHEKRKAETEMKRMELKAERLRSRAQEKLANKLAAVKRIAEEKRANAETKLNENAARTSEKADYLRRAGHLPSSFCYFKLPWICN